MLPEEPRLSEQTGEASSMGRDVDVGLSSYRREMDAAQLKEELTVRKLNEDPGMGVQRARFEADRLVKRAQGIAVDPEGRRTSTGEGGLLDFIPQTRASRITERTVMDPNDPAKVVKQRLYRDPETGLERPPTPMEEVIEAHARQQLLTAEEADRLVVARKQAVQDRLKEMVARGEASFVEDEAALRRAEQFIVAEQKPLVSGLLSGVEEETGIPLETTVGATLSSIGGLVSAGLNEAIFNYAPLFWDMDENGAPVDPGQVAYKIHSGLQDAMLAAGMDPDTVVRATTGSFGATPLPMPFQGIQRAQPTVFDPAGLRTAQASGNFLADVGVSLARRRTRGDELMSIPAFAAEQAERAERRLRSTQGYAPTETGQLPGEESLEHFVDSTYPYWLGIGSEMLDPTGTGVIKGLMKAGKVGAIAGAAQAAKATEKALSAAEKAAEVGEAGKAAGYLGAAGAAMAMEKGLDAAAKALDPVETAKRVRTLRVAQDLAEGRLPTDELEALADRHSVRRVAAEKIAEELVTPYALAAKVSSEAPGDVAALHAIAGDSLSAQEVLRRAGLSTRSNRALARDDIAKVLRAVEDYKVSALRSVLDDIASGAGSEQAKTRQVLDVLAEFGVSEATVKRLFPYLDQVVDGGATVVRDHTRFAARAVGDFATPIRPGNAVQRALHDIGAQVEAARFGSGRLVGPLGELLHKRLGGADLTPRVLANEQVAVAQALRGAAARAVEASLENAVPDNLVFVTRGLMAPRSLLTPDVYKQVGGIVDKFTATPVKGPVLDGVPTTLYRFDKGAPAALAALQATLAFGDRLDRSPMLSAAIDKVRNGDLITGREYEVLRDAVLERAWRRALRGSEAAKEAVFAGAQVERARIPGVNVGLETASAARVPRRAFGQAVEDVGVLASEAMRAATPTVLQNAAKKAVAAMDKRAGEGPWGPQTPAALVDFEGRLAERWARVGDALGEEVRAASIEAMRAGQPAGNGLNIVVNRRVQQAMGEVVDNLDRQVAQMMRDRGMVEGDAWWLVGYQAVSGKPVEGFGEASSAVAQAQAIDTMKGLEMQRLWHNLVLQFFGEEVFNAKLLHGEGAGLLELALTKNVLRGEGLDPSVAKYKEISIDTFNEVIEDLRKFDPDLRTRGLARGTTDATAETLLGWAAGRDRHAVTLEETRILQAEHPELFVEVMPSSAGPRPERIVGELEVVQAGRLAILNRLAEMGASLPAEAVELFTDLSNTVNKSGLLGAAEGGGFADRLDTILSTVARTATPAARKKVVEEFFAQAAELGRPDIDWSEFVRGADSTIGGIVTNKGWESEAAKGVLKELLVVKDPSALSAADQVLHAAVSQVHAKGVDLFDVLVPEVRQAAVQAAVETIYAPLVSEFRQGARSIGATPGLPDAPGLSTLVASIDPASPTVLFTGPKFADVNARLIAAAGSGRLVENLEHLRKYEKLRGAKGGEYLGIAGEYLGEAWAWSRSAAAGGLLAGGWYIGSLGEDETFFGIPVPNTRYMGMNLLTAPLIALTTVGASNAIKALRPMGGVSAQSLDVARRVSSMVGRPLVDATSARPWDSELFTDVMGRTWTYGEVQDALARNNVLITRSGVEFNDSFGKELLRDARILANGAPAGPLRTFLRNFDPVQTNIWQYVANATDRAFRYNAFATALQEGATEAQAAELARAVVLDYGRAPDAVKQVLNKYILFATFRTAMATEVLDSLTRDPKVMVATIRAHKGIQQSGEQWLLGTDQAKARLVLDPRQHLFDRAAAATVYGPSSPALGALNDFVSMGGYVANLGADDNNALARAAQGVLDEGLVPAVDAFLEEYLAEKDQRRQKVPDDVVAWAVANGADSLWPLMRREFNIVPVTLSTERTPGRPTARGFEWKFETPQDAARFRAYLTLSVYLGVRRSTIDYTNLGRTFGPQGELDPKRRALPSPLGFAIGAETPVGTPSPEELLDRAIYEQQKVIDRMRPKKR